MSETAFIALYGTLLSCQFTAMAQAMKQALVFQSRCQIPGKIYHMGRYPAFKPDASDTIVAGELYKIIDPAILALLDEYESQDDHDATLPGFSRQRIKLAYPRVAAWVYVYQGPVDDQQVISSGKWRLVE